MSQDHIDLVKRAYDLWNAGEMEAAKRMCAPDATMSTPRDWPDSISSSARDEMFKRLVENRALFESDRLRPERWIDGDTAACRRRWKPSGRGSSDVAGEDRTPRTARRGDKCA
jgi:ketosteroid isomerase-like protein